MTKGKAGKTPRDTVVICISGMAGSGKSTVAKRLADRYGLRYYSGGDTLKALALEEGYQNIEHGWWESAEGMRFLTKRSKNPKSDKLIDEKLLQLAQDGNVVLDSWTMPWLIEKGFKIWLEASPKKRAERIAIRDGLSPREALKALRNKEKQTRDIYKRLYGFDLGEDYTPFQLILDTDDLETDEVFQILCKIMDSCVFHSENLHKG